MVTVAVARFINLFCSQFCCDGQTMTVHIFLFQIVSRMSHPTAGATSRDDCKPPPGRNLLL